MYGLLITLLSNERIFDQLFRDSKLTMLLRESLGNINCRTTMIAHISDSPASFTESLSTVQLASRIHRMRKKKSKAGSFINLLFMIAYFVCFSVMLIYRYNIYIYIYKSSHVKVDVLISVKASVSSRGNQWCSPKGK